MLKFKTCLCSCKFCWFCQQIIEIASVKCKCVRENIDLPEWAKTEEFVNFYNETDFRFEKKTNDFLQITSKLTDDQKIKQKVLLSKIRRSIEFVCYGELKIIVLKFQNIEVHNQEIIIQKIGQLAISTRRSRNRIEWYCRTVKHKLIHYLHQNVSNK